MGNIPHEKAEKTGWEAEIKHTMTRKKNKQK
jgi:hypothetical protein